ncbi:MAG: DHH family phosphoesterase [Desulfomonilaceae bacterium]|nr:DHH family phosphoesterase [Desulfomonilaceae bacterium]
MNSSRWDTGKTEAKLVELEAVLRGIGNQRLLILCHNNPDPDTIASAYGFSFLLSKRFGIRSVLGHGGVVTRAENKAMIQRLRINITKMSRLVPSRYFGIAAVDSQPGTGNNLLASRGVLPLIVIDHHPLRKLSRKVEFYDIRPTYGATSTIVTEYLVAADITPTRRVANALLYGLKTDTHSLVRTSSPNDFKAFNFLSPLTNPRVLGYIEKPSLDLEYFDDHHRGLAHAVLYRDVAVSCLGKIHTESIIPELADLLLRIDGVSWSLCMGELNDLMIISLRSTSRKYRAGTVIRRLIGKSGFAGGHKEMAGGQVPLSGMNSGEKEELRKRLVERFLRLIDRRNCVPKRLVNSAEPAGEECDAEL